jgi:hypothetical protein
MADWQKNIAKVALKVLKPLLVSIALQFVSAFFSAARVHFDGKENPEARYSVEGAMSPQELEVTQDLLHVLENRAMDHVEQAIDEGGIPSFDLSAQSPQP